MSKVALYQKIVKVMEEVGQFQKDGSIIDKDDKLVYKYLSEEQTTAGLQKAFVNQGLVLFPIKVESELINLKTMKYDKVVEAPVTKVIVTYKICDSETGESEELQSIGYGSDSQDKGSNKAMTGAFKYVQRQTFMISTGDDGDHTASEELNKHYSHPKTSQEVGQARLEREQEKADARQQNAPDSHYAPEMDLDMAAIAESSEQLYSASIEISDGQVKMLFAKGSQAGLNGEKDKFYARVSAFLGYPIKDLKHVRKADVTRLAQYLDQHKQKAS